MASKLYPTLSAFYKAGNIGFGSEHDAMLGGVPEEKLYRKPSRQRGELPLHSAQSSRQLDPTLQYGDGTCGSDVRATRDTPANSIPPAPTDENSPPLTPSAPPLLEMLDMRLQQYLNMLLASNNNAPDNTVFPSDNTQTNASLLDSDSHPADDKSGGHTTVTLPLPPNVVVEDSWLDEIRPDYDDLEPGDMAGEILNNLNVDREEDTKDHEKQKSLSLLRTPKDSQVEASSGQEEKKSQQMNHHRENPRHRHSYQPQPSQGSREDNEDVDESPHHQHHHHQHNPHHARHNHRHKSHGATRLQERESQSREDLRLAGRTKRQDSAVERPLEPSGRDRRRDVANPHRRSHHNASRSKHEGGQSASDPAEGLRESGKPSPRKKTSPAEKENQQRSPRREGRQEENSDYNAWMTWRKQVTLKINRPCTLIFMVLLVYCVLKT